MGRTVDGGYAEYTCVPAGQVIPFRSDLEPAVLGAVPETLQAAYGSLTGMLSDRWTVPDFYPIGYLPRGVRLSAYGGEAADLPAPVLQRFLDTARIPVAKVYAFADIAAAHADMEANRVAGKLVVTLCTGVYADRHGA